MAQARVDEYFTTRKRNSSVQPSKRRKIVLPLNSNERQLKQQLKVTDLFSRPKTKSSVNENSQTQAIDASPEFDSQTETVTEEITSEWDDRVGIALNTPRKRKMNLETAVDVNIVNKIPKRKLTREGCRLASSDGIKACFPRLRSDLSEALKDRLKKSGKVSDLKKKLGDLKKSLDEVKEREAAKLPVVSQDKERDPTKTDRLPAFQRFQHLVEPGTPTLSLPYNFKILEDYFQAMDQVVSMLHNRTEICTFSKLKVAVQNITRKNFEEKTVAQIKAIVPDAYIFRQEKNIPSLGQQANSYHLTIEPNLQSEEPSNSSKDCPKTSGGKPVFSASMLIKRKRWFSNNLLSYLKQLHKVFLATLNPPLEVPDDQLMRWHPKFQLDKVDVTPSPLPQSPDVKIYRTAKDVLENQRGKLNPMVERALTNVVEKDLMANKKNTPPLATNPVPQPSSLSKSNQTESIKGIPPALLAKIRAKEAKRIEEILIRKPEEDIKLKIMNRLPEIIRTLRAIFVTEKKPALPLEDVCKKLEANYKNGISQRDVEQHVNMLRELAPELISIVEIKRGKYLKFDKNVDVQAVCGRIMNLVKSKK